MGSLRHSARVDRAVHGLIERRSWATGAAGDDIRSWAPRQDVGCRQPRLWSGLLHRSCCADRRYSNPRVPAAGSRARLPSSAPLLLLDPVLATVTAAFNARSQLAFTAWYQLVQCFVSAGIAVAVIAGGHSIVGLAFAALAADLCAVLLALVLVRTKLRLAVRLRQPPRSAFSFLRTALPIGGIGLVGRRTTASTRSCSPSFRARRASPATTCRSPSSGSRGLFPR